MGLDNGIILETKVPIRYKPWFTEFELTDEGVDNKGNKFYCYDLTYWRKCWGLRAEIFEAIGVKKENEIYEYNLDLEEIKSIIKILFKVNNPYKWDALSGIWDYEDSTIGKMIFYQIGTLMWTYEWWNKRPQDIIRCYFYDSY